MRLVHNLPRKCRLLRAFLANVHFCEDNNQPARGALYAPGITMQLAVERYANVWMPLLAESQKHQSSTPMLLAAPIDVQWIHHLDDTLEKGKKLWLTFFFMRCRRHGPC